MFAARAFKSAIFGTPARPDPATDDRQLQTGQKEDAVETTSSMRDRATPGRLPGILLTPGTATSRRKRVSFGHNVEYDESSDTKPVFKIDKNARKPGLFGDKPKQPRTVLAQALENSRNQHNKAAAEEKQSVAGADDDNAWEEVDDNDNDNNGGDPDVTVDLNEPHSQSGRYWKSQFQRYQEDAKVEMSKLLKYKQLAKSYAKMKDSEAGDMHAKLREEKDRVAQMEARITQLANQIARTRTKGSDHDYQELISDLTRQTALAVQYRNQVKELEAMLQDTNADDVFREAGNGSEASSGATSRRWAQSTLTSATSPRTQKTLIDTQRELRRARDQAKELTQVKEEVRRLKTALRAAEQRAVSSENESKSLAADLASSEAASDASASKVQDLEKRAKFAEDERRRKDDELRLLQRKYDSLKEDAKARVGEAEQVLRRKNEQIADLKRQLKQGTTTHNWGGAAEDNLMDLDIDPVPVKTTGKAEKETATTRTATTVPTSLAALEKITRNRYENLANRRSLEQKKVPLKQQSNAGGIEGLVIDIDDLHFDNDEPELPQQKLNSKHKAKHSQKDEPIVILEDESCHFELPPIRTLEGKNPGTTTGRSALGARLRRKKAGKDDGATMSEDEGDQDAVAAANLILLRRRRAAEPLRPIGSRQTGLLESVDLNSKAPATATDSKYRPLATRKRVASSAIVHSVRAQGREEHADPVAAAAAAAADASSLSISSTRAAAAVARIEKRRAERQRELGLQQNKENMQPA